MANEHTDPNEGKKPRSVRLLIDFAGAAMASYYTYDHYQAYEPGWVAFFAFQAGGLFVDGVAQAVQIAHGDTHFIPVLGRFGRKKRFNPDILDDDFSNDADQDRGPPPAPS